MPIDVGNNQLNSVGANVLAYGNVVTDGLTAYLDSGIASSYPGSGTTWYDLSGYGNNGTMYGFTGPSAGSTSGYDTTTGLMMFDRHSGGGDGDVNNRVIINNSTSLQDVLCQNGMTIDMWVKQTTYVCTALTKWAGSWEVYYCSPLVFRVEGTGGADLNTGVATSVGTWRNLIATHNGTTAKMYVNGVEVMSVSNPISGQNTTSNIAIGAYESGIYATVGAIPIYRLYNRPITASEVLQNFNANRRRFNI
jgi:hypothetical protein